MNKTIEIEVDINKMRTGLSIIYMRENFKEMPEDKVIEFFLKSTYKFGVLGVKANEKEI